MHQALIPTASCKNRLHPGYSHPIMREWQQMASSHAGRLPSKQQIVYPLFVLDGKTGDEIEAIQSMPGIQRLGKNKVIEHLAPLVEKGLCSVILFGILGDSYKHLKDERGSRADAIDGSVISAIKMIKKTFPDLLIICDICLCAYTIHGHCGILHQDGSLNNTLSVQRLSEVALAYAQAGAHIVAPSDMMDHRVLGIKHILQKHELDAKVALLSYSAKFASCFYGPFREAVDSAPAFGDRRCYQLPPGSRGLALRAIERDLEEGADFLMIKPAGPYLDIVQEASCKYPNVPIAVYQVSGEYSTLYYAAEHAIFDLKRALLEIMRGFSRAGATIIVSYFAPQLMEWLPND